MIDSQESTGKAPATVRPGTALGRRKRRPSARWPFLYILPLVAVTLLVFAYPLVRVIQYSLENVGGAGPAQYVGLQNFAFLFTDPTFWRAVQDNLTLVLAVPLLIVVSLLFAILLYEKLWGWRVYRMVIFLPYTISSTAIGLAFGFIYQYNGVLNTMLRSVGLGALALNWIGEPQYVMFSIMAVILWQQLGFGVVVLLARLSSLPAQTLEAARIDGASWWHMHVRVTVPQLRSAIEFLAVVETITMLSWVFNYVYVITQAGPALSSIVLEYYIFQNAFAYSSMGIAAAAAVVLLAGTMVLVLFYYRLRRPSTSTEEA